MQASKKKQQLQTVHCYQSLEKFQHQGQPMLNKQNQESILTTKLQLMNHFSCFHIQSNTIYLGTRNSKFIIYNIITTKSNQGYEQIDDFTLKQELIITTHCQTISCIRSNQEYFVIVPETDDDCFISIWSVTTKNYLYALKAHESQISQVIFFSNKKNFATASWDCMVKIWCLSDSPKDVPINAFQGQYPILQIKQYNEEVLIIGGDDCYLIFWNWKKNQIIKKEFGHAGSVTYMQMVFNYLFTAGGDNKYKFWKITVSQSSSLPQQENTIDFKQKYQIKKVSQLKEDYDPIVFGTFYNQYLLLIDKQGQLYIFFNQNKFYRFPEFIEGAIGINAFKDFLLIATAKGCLKYMNIKAEIQKLSQSSYLENNVFIEATPNNS